VAPFTVAGRESWYGTLPSESPGVDLFIFDDEGSSLSREPALSSLSAGLFR